MAANQLRADLQSLETHLGEPNGCRLFSEALTTQIKSIFADEPRLVGAEPAERDNQVMDAVCFAVVRTIDGCPFRIFWGERTKQRRESFLLRIFLRWLMTRRGDEES
jgi:hypothetical protein